MDSSQGSSSSSLPPFLTKTYEMVDDESTNEIVSWSSTNSSFIVWNPLQFSKDLLPKYFKHNNFSSFVRQLNTYGFHKVDPDLWEFANEDFIKGERHRLKNIHRRKPIFSHSSQNSSLSETERHQLEEEIERLKLEKNSLILGISKQAEIKQEMDSLLHSLEDKLRVLEDRQRDLIEYLSQNVNKPGFISSILRQGENINKRRRHGESDLSEIPILPLIREPFERVESSLNSLENFLRGVSEAYGQEDMYYDQIAPGIPITTVILTELEETGSPAIMIPEIIPAIDMNSEPKIREIEIREMESGIEKREMKSGQNDVFWEQFLTEHPGGNNEGEVQSQRRDEKEAWLLNKRNLEGLTEKMVNLSSKEKS